jgi:hypothetical protein
MLLPFFWPAVIDAAFAANASASSDASAVRGLSPRRSLTHSPRETITARLLMGQRLMTFGERHLSFKPFRKMCWESLNRIFRKLSSISYWQSPHANFGGRRTLT